MKSLVRFPIRLKIMVSLLSLVTVVVSVITFLMANLFHEDKRAYINDWISIAAMSTADECRTVMEDYSRRLRLYARILLNNDIPVEEKTPLLEAFFDDFPELVDIAIHREGQEPRTANDLRALESVGLTRQDLLDDRELHPLPMAEILAGKIHVENSTLTERMPSFTLAMAEQSGAGTPIVIVAVIRSDRLQELQSRFEVFDVALTSTDGVLLTHPDIERVVRRESANLITEAMAVYDENQASLTVEFVKDEVPMIGGFAAVEFAGITASAQIPKSAAFLASRALLDQLLKVAFVLLMLIAVGGLIWSRRLTRPLEHLSGATRTIAKGDFNIAVAVESRDEIGALAGSFNQMASELKSREEALNGAQAQLIQSEKLAAFGQLGAGIAHEVKNPLAGILGCAQLSLMELEEGTRIQKNVKIIEKETERCKTIIDNLLKFARQEKTAFDAVQLNQVVEDSAAICNHQLELHEVKLVTDLTHELPMIRGSANQLQQVLMNLIMNAQQAMEGRPGQVTVTTRVVDTGKVQVVVGDDGPGIPPEIQSKLFEPFFTTKPTGKGTGLGLSVSFGIVHEHAGEIVIESEPGQGAAFVITLPAAGPVAPEAGVASAEGEVVTV